MQRYTAHATNDGSLLETKYYYHQVMRTAKEFRVETPNLSALGSYL